MLTVVQLADTIGVEFRDLGLLFNFQISSSFKEDRTQRVLQRVRLHKQE